MKLTREHKILLGVLGAGLLALGVDRFVLSDPATGPQTAAADEYTVTPAPDGEAVPPTAAPATAGPAPVVHAGPTIAQTLRDTRQQHAGLFTSSRDAFEMMPGWAKPVEAAPAQPMARVDPQGEKVDRFLQQHKLSAVMNNDIAIINARPYRVGDTIDGAVLVRLDRKSATMQANGLTFILPLEGDQP